MIQKSLGMPAHDRQNDYFTKICHKNDYFEKKDHYISDPNVRQSSSLYDGIR